jgi:CrcB protein
VTQLLAVAAGGALGALLRYGVSLYVLLLERSALGPEWRLALLVGLLGAFTTFSSFAIETLVLVEEGAPLRALLNVVASVVTCLAACWAGLWIGRSL